MMVRLCFILATLIYTIYASADVVKWKDANGVVHYSDKAPINSKAEIIQKDKQISIPKKDIENANNANKNTQNFLPPELRDHPPAEIPRESVIIGGINDVDAVPYLNEKTKKGYLVFLAHNKPRIFIVCKNGESIATYGTKNIAIAKLLEGIKDKVAPANENCDVYAINDEVVWKKPKPQVRESRKKVQS